MLADFAFDYSHFYVALLDASRKGFNLLKELHLGETFYCFALYSHGSYGFVYTTGNTEEALMRTAQAYVNQPNWSHYATLDEMRTMLRHHIGDSPLLDHYLLLEPFFQEVFELAEARSNQLHDIWVQLAHEIGDDKAFEMIEPHQQQFLEAQ